MQVFVVCSYSISHIFKLISNVFTALGIVNGFLRASIVTMLNVMAVKLKKALKTQVAMNEASVIACITLLPNFLNCMLKFFFSRLADTNKLLTRDISVSSSKLGFRLIFFFSLRSTGIYSVVVRSFGCSTVRFQSIMNFPKMLIPLSFCTPTFLPFFKVFVWCSVG